MAGLADTDIQYGVLVPVRDVSRHLAGRRDSGLTLARIREKALQVLKLTYQHSRNLGTYVGLYKASMYLLKSMNSTLR